MMYTRCPSCSSVFRVSATLLQMADGDVRCGSCGAVFNALHTLLDDWSVPPAAPADAGPDEIAGEPEPGSDPYGTEFGEPGIDSPAAASDDVVSAAPEPRREPLLEIADDLTPPLSRGQRPNLEFDVPEDEWQLFFNESNARAQRPAPAPAPGRPAGEPVATPEELEALAGVDELMRGPGHFSLEEETSDTDTWQAFLADTEDFDLTGPADEDEDRPLLVVSEDLQLAEVLVRHGSGESREPPAVLDEGASDGGPGDARTGEEVPDQAMDSSALAEGDFTAGSPTPPGEEAQGLPTSTDQEPAPAVPDLGQPVPARATDTTVLDWGPLPAFGASPEREPARNGRWFALSLLALLTLAAQLVHYDRDELAVSPRFGRLVRDGYARMGLPLHPAWPLDAYEVRGARAIAENSAPGALDIVAEIAVTGPEPVGLPVVRVVLRDRWSNIIGSGIFDAPSYLAEAAPASGIYAPGSLIPVQISLADPGTAAQGYEFDVCIPDRRLGLQCRNARDPFRR